MDYDFYFKIFNTSVLLPWLMMLVLPTWRGTQFLLKYPIFPLILAVGYSIFIGVDLIGGTSEGMDFSSLESIKQLFTRDVVVLAGWIHYLAFDLFVGMWELRDAQKHRIHHLLVVPCLVFTLMLGPVGLLLYFIIRAILLKKSIAVEA
ncbi:MAG: DUF4281 domain-containing protein [Saprospiraceae bacterium]|nr:DUF4281 domain-containing protein [Saprospiraceae bacterium]